MSTPSKYRKKPVVIEAVHYDGSFPMEFLGDSDRVASAGDGTGAIEIHTLEGTMRADVGDWIIRGVQGEFYPCKPEIFEATYEAVEEATPSWQDARGTLAGATDEPAEVILRQLRGAL